MELPEDATGMIRSAAQIADNVFGIEENVIDNGFATPEQYNQAKILVDDFKDVMEEIDEIVGMKHDVSFMDNHVKIIEDYLFAEREPLRDEVLELIEGNKPTVLERKKVGDRILSKILDFVDTFINGMTGK